MPTTIDLSTTALIKVALHAAKYPAAPVCGVLLGRSRGKGGGGGADGGAAGEAGGQVRVVDAVPLLHTGLGLAPMLEVGLCQADAYARSRDLRLVGYYQANERPDDGDLASYGGRAAADAVARAAAAGSGSEDEAEEAGGGASTSSPPPPPPFAIVLSGAALGDVAAGRAPPPGSSLVTLWTRSKVGGGGGGGGQWAPGRPADAALATPPGVGDLIRSALASPGRGPAALSDFDDHLLDLRRDWRNEGLV